MTLIRALTDAQIAAHQAKVAQGRKSLKSPQNGAQVKSGAPSPKSRPSGQETAAMGTSGRRPNLKYRNQPCVVDGYRFASKHEAQGYAKLRLRQQAGQIAALQLQVWFALHVNGVRVASYVADFCYQENGQLVVADAKGVRTPLYKLKKKMLAAEYGIKILEL